MIASNWNQLKKTNVNSVFTRKSMDCVFEWEDSFRQSSAMKVMLSMQEVFKEGNLSNSDRN